MFPNAAIIGVGQSAYTRHPQPGQTTHTFIRDAVVAALADAQVDARDVDGMAAASFSLAPDSAIDLAWKLGLSLTWLMQDTNGGSSAMNMLGHATRARRLRRGLHHPRGCGRRHRPRRLRQGGDEPQHRDARPSQPARPRRAEWRLRARHQPADEKIRPAEIRLRPHRRRAARLGGEKSARRLPHAADHGGIPCRAARRRSAGALRLCAGGGGRAGDRHRASRPRAARPRAGAPARASRELQLRQPGGRRLADRHQHIRVRAVAGGRRAARTTSISPASTTTIRPWCWRRRTTSA